MQNRIVLISKNPEDHQFAQEIGSLLSIPVVIVPNSEGALQLISESYQDILFVDVSGEQELLDYKDKFIGKVGNSPGQTLPRMIHLIANEQIEGIAALVQENQFGHIVIRKFGNPKEAGHYYSRLIDSICLKRKDFDIANLLKTTESINVTKIYHSSEKLDILEKIRKFLVEDAAFAERVVNTVVTSLDEILMNAIYDAPLDEEGKQKFAKVTRDTPIALDEKSAVELHTGFDGEYIGFKVIDNFGSLNGVKLFKHLFATHEVNPYEVDRSVENAGLGLGNAFRMGASLMFVSQRGVRTEVMTFYKLSNSYREFKNQFRFISLHTVS